MLTTEQLARIEWLIKSFTKGHISKDDYSEVLGFVPDMLAELTRLQTALTAKDDFTDQVDQYAKRIELKVDGLDTNINDLLKVIERLSEIIKVKDRVLSQFADSANWEYEPAQYGPEGRKELPCEWYWINVLSPQDLANQALNEGHE